MPSDDFNRSNGALGAAWLQPANFAAATISGNAVVSSTGTGAAGVMPGLRTADGRCSVTLRSFSGGNDFYGLLLRTTNESTAPLGYYVEADPLRSVVSIYRGDAGGPARLATVSGIRQGAGDLLAASIAGSRITAFMNGVAVLTADDATYKTPGTYGFYVDGTNVVDDFSSAKLGTYLGEVMDDAPNVLFRLGETSGTAAADYIGGASGAYVGGYTLNQPSLVGTDSNPAARFNGSTGYVRVANRAAFSVGDTFTLEALVKLDSLPRSGTTAIVLDKGTRGFIVRIEPDGSVIFRCNSVADIATATVRLTAGPIYLIQVTKAGSSIRMVINGVDVTPARVTNTTISNTTIEFDIASADAGTAGNMLAGTVDEVAVYPTALSLARLQAHFSASRAATVGTLGMAVETSSATVLRPVKVRLLGAATSSESARAVSARKARPLNLVTETSTASAAAARKRRMLSTAIEVDLAAALTAQFEAPPPDTEPPTFLTIDSVTSTSTIAALATTASVDSGAATSAPLDQLATEVAIDA